MYFARGACTEGTNCRFYHRVPQDEDIELAEKDNLRDVFGRARHATHKDNNQGIGSFNKECRTILVSRIKLDPEATQGKAQAMMQSNMTTKEVVRLIYEHFCSWGEIEDIHFNTARF